MQSDAFDPDKMALTGAMHDVLWCLFKNGPTWDGNIPSKTGRGMLIEGGLVYHDQGWSILTTYGFHACIAAGMDKKKGTR
jgi:hypothetical protein